MDFKLAKMTKKKVFIFDDNIELLELCCLILEGAGFEVKTTSTSDGAALQVLDYMPDVIFMDNWLPSVSGIDATRAIKANEEIRHIPVIYFSANNNVNELAREAGADDFLAKPFDINDLEKIVRKYT